VSEIITVSFKTEADFRNFTRGVQDGVQSLESLRDIANETKATLGKKEGNIFEAKFEVGAQVSGLREFKQLNGLLDKTEDGYNKNAAAVNKLFAVDQKSLFSRRQALSQARQMLNAMDAENKGRREQEERVRALTVEVRRLNGVQAGSVNDIRAESKALQEQLGNLNLSQGARANLVQQINRYSEAERRAAGIQEGSIDDLRALADQQERLARSLQIGSEAQLKAAKNAQEYNNRIAAATPKTLTFIGALNKIATVQAGIQAITTGIAQLAGSVNQVVSRLKQIEAFNLALRNIGLSAQDAAKYFGQASRTAFQLGAPIEQVEKAYKRILPALRDIGTGASEADRFIANLTARTQVLGLTTEESGRLQEAFAQVLAKGKLQAEELTQQISEVDGAFRTQFAQAIGVTAAELSQLASDGVITASVFVKGVNEMSNGTETLTENIRNGNATIQQLQNNIGNIQTKTLEGIGRAIEPGIRAFLRATQTFVEFVQKVAESQVGKLLAETFNQVAYATEAFVKTLTTALNVFVQLLAPVAGLLRVFSPLIGLLVYYVAVAKTVQLATAGIGFVMKVASGEAIGLAAKFQGAAKAAVAFGNAYKLIFSGNIAAGFTQLTNSARLFIQSLNIPYVNQFGVALQNLTKSQAAASAVNALQGATGRLGGVLGKAKGYFTAFGQGLQMMKKDSTASSAATVTLTQKVGSLGKSLLNAGGLFSSFSQGINGIKAANQQAGKSNGLLVNTFSALGDVTNLFGGKVGNLLGKFKGLRGVTGAANTALNATGSVVGKTTAANKVYTDSLGNVIGRTQFLRNKLLGGGGLPAGLADTATKMQSLTVAQKAATSGIGKFSGILAKALPLLPKVALGAAGFFVVSTAVEVGVNSFFAWKEAIAEATPGLQQLDADLKKFGISTKAAQGPLGGLIEGIKKLFAPLRAIGDAWEYFIGGIERAARAAGFKQATDQLVGAIAKVDVEFKKAGLGGVTDFTNASKLSAEQAKNFVGALGALAAASEQQAAAIQAKIDKQKEEGKENSKAAKQLQEQLAITKERAAGFRILERQLAAQTQEQRLNTLATAEGLTYLEKSRAAIKAKNEEIEQGLQGAQLEFQKEYNKGLITESELELKNAAVAVAAAKAKIDGAKQVLEAERSKEQGVLEFVNDRQQAEIDALQAQREAAKELEQAEAVLKEKQLARIQEVSQAAQDLADIYRESADIAISGFDTFSSSLMDALEAMRDDIAQASIIEFELTGDESLLNRALEVQGKMIEAEYKIGKIKNQVQQAQRAFELEMQALRIKTLMLEAQQRGGPQAQKLVAAYQQQLGVIDKIRGLNAVIAKSEDLALESKTRGLQRAYNLSAQTVGLPPLKLVQEKNSTEILNDVNGLLSDADKASADIGNTITNSFNSGLGAARSGFEEVQDVSRSLTEDVAKYAQGLEKGVKEFSDAVKEISSKNYGVKIADELSKALGGAFDNFNKSLQSSPKVVNDVKSATEGVKNAFNDSNTAAGNLNTTIEQTNRLLEDARRLSNGLPLGTGTPARATGGPVAAGANYLVNDGGGREAFMDMAGRVSLLPASRNIKWRAPRDGFVLPAPMTETLVQNSKINAKIASVASSTTPRQSMSVSPSGVASSGNLIKQMGAMMSGNNTQRITNHVTIQSQSPVMDASKIMANVNRLRARRGIRQ